MNGFPSTQHRDLLLNAQRSLHDALPLIDLAESVGLDASEYRQGHAYLSDRVGRYLSRLFPDQPIPGHPAQGHGRGGD